MTETASQEIRWGMIGCGDVAEVKSGPGFQKANGSRLVAVMRRSGYRARDYASRHGVPRWYDNATSLIHDPEVDAVYIATPPGSHRDYALDVCAAGKPAYVEKPMARNATECREMVDAFKARNIPLFVAYYRRALPRFLKVQELVADGRLGTLTQVSYRYDRPEWPDLNRQQLPWRLQAVESGGGLFFDVGSHVLDILDFVLGPLGEVEGTAANRGGAYEVEDSVAMSFRTRSGIPGAATWNFSSCCSRDCLELTGTAGQLSLAVFGNSPVRLERDGRIEEIDLPSPEHIQQPMIQSIVNTLLGRGECCSTGESAARTAAVMDRAVGRYYGSRADQFWTDPQCWPGRTGPTRQDV
ncbi:1,5-anhydro-D-fructose reductase [Maioricimonas rarisocia]|uniref:1,5-anhydro-D-fructose reductase n=1 Tax=Maioricimonas rarisocia TaxID=2528026 RepID=A0A517Z0W5_9PLAN|nr:Gfo/Idh/MocA family oxidoreductase [Maioricimonas rarisocia]QDU36105.1 1,5-anhydro-D-fructose reductase [Maioricimonas rarisocia]